LAPVALGSFVTTLRFGMADPDWPTAPWHLLLVRATDQLPLDFLVEHTHRAAGYLIGYFAVVLAVVVWFDAHSRALRWFGTAALLGVVIQGLLGGFRVKLDELFGANLAAIHGFFAQMVFSLLVGVAVLSAPRRAEVVLSGDYARRCRRAAVVLSALALLQVAFGVLVRHTHTGVAQRLHALTAFAVVAAVAWLVKTAFEDSAGRRVLSRTALILVALVFVQVALGVEAWISLYGGQPLPEAEPVTPSQLVLRTAHLLVGAGVLATAVAAVLQTYRAAAPRAEAAPVAAPQPEGTA
jgi:heme A synthase